MLLGAFMASFPVRTGRTPINILFQLILSAGDQLAQVGYAFVVQKAESIPVPDGCTVYLRGVRASSGANLAAVWVGKSRDAVANLLQGPAQVIAPNTQVPFPCSNTGEIWLCGSPGDGVLIQIVG